MQSCPKCKTISDDGSVICDCDNFTTGVQGVRRAETPSGADSLLKNVWLMVVANIVIALIVILATASKPTVAGPAIKLLATLSAISWVAYFSLRPARRPKVTIVKVMEGEMKCAFCGSVRLIEPIEIAPKCYNCSRPLTLETVAGKKAV